MGGLYLALQALCGSKKFIIVTYNDIMIQSNDKNSVNIAICEHKGEYTI